MKQFLSSSALPQVESNVCSHIDWLALKQNPALKDQLFFFSYVEQQLKSSNFSNSFQPKISTFTTLEELVLAMLIKMLILKTYEA